MNNFYISKYESDFLKIKIARNHDPLNIDFNSLNEFIKENHIKLFRLKSDNHRYPAIAKELYDQKLQAYYSHTVLTFRIRYTGTKAKEYVNESLDFIRVKPEMKADFYQVILQGMSDDPIGYYKTPVTSKSITKDQELLCYASFYANLYSGDDPAKIGWLLKQHDKIVGAFVFELEGNEVFTSMACVTPENRNNGLFHDMKIFRQQYCLENDIKWASNGSRMYNLTTPNLLLKEGYKLIKTETIMHVV